MMYLVTVLVLSGFYCAGAFYLPGLAPVTYCTQHTSEDTCKSEISVYANRLRSTKTLLPYEYSRFNFCPVQNGSLPSLNLGQVVMGERIQLSQYKFIFGNSETECRKACEKVYKPSSHGNHSVDDSLEFLKYGMRLNYQYNWIVDNVPVTWCYITKDGKNTDEYCTRDIPIGCYTGDNQGQCVIDAAYLKQKPDTYIVFNHMHFTIRYRKQEDSNSKTSNVKYGRILSVRVKPYSVGYTNESDLGHYKCYKYDRFPKLIIPAYLEKEFKIIYSYTVQWVEEDGNIVWGTRWDYLLDSHYDNIMIFSAINSVICIAFLIGILGRILWQTLHNNNSEKEMFWKLLHGDVFRPPRNKIILCAIVGNGLQVFVMATVVLGYACVGLVSPANRGALMTCILIIYACVSPVSGFTSARLYRMFGGEKKKTLVFVTAFLFQSIMFGLTGVTNTIHWLKGTSAAIPALTYLVLLSLWWFLSVPLICLGAFCGFRKKVIEQPVRTSEDARKIPSGSCLARIKMFLRLLMNIIPFSTLFIHLFFILNSLWAHQIYYVFGFSYLQYCLFIISVVITAPVMCYFQLCDQDYHWWWKTMYTSIITSVLILLYMIYYLFVKSDIEGIINIYLYIVYSLMMVIPVYLLTCAMAFISTFMFVKKIYSVVKQ